MSARALASQFGVSVRTAHRLTREQRERDRAMAVFTAMIGEACGKTQIEIAAALGVSQPTVHRMLTGWTRDGNTVTNRRTGKSFTCIEPEVE